MSYPLTVTDEDDRLEPSALTATTLTAVGPRPVRTRTVQLPSPRTATGSPFTVTLAPAPVVPEISTSPDPVFTVLMLLMLA